MNTRHEIAMVLTRIRNCYTQIRMLTLDCLSENDPGSIPTLMQNREDILGLIASEERKLEDEALREEPVATLRDEIRSIISSIMIIDRQLTTFIRGNLSSISLEMGKLYKKSRAASAYSGQSIW